MGRLFFCGEALIDFVPVTAVDGRTLFDAKPGGSPFNAAKAAALAGGEVAFVGAVSTDFFGDMLIGDLAAAGVDCAAAARLDAPTTLAFVDLSGADPRYAFFNTGSATVRMAPEAAALAAGPGDILNVGSIALIEPPGADRITEFALAVAERALLCIDPNARPEMIADHAAWARRIERLMAAAAIIRLSTEDIAAIAPGQGPNDFAAARLAAGAALVIVTDGAAGATAHTPAGRAHRPAPAVTLADAVGAGDVLNGAILARLSALNLTGRDDLAGMDSAALDDLLAHGVTAAAINCTRSGCAPPTGAEIAAARARR